jgi:heme/copper-type cytochrome/quinol oxidase subunit 2
VTLAKNILDKTLFILILEFLLFKVSEAILKSTKYVFRGWVTNVNLVIFFIIFCLLILKFLTHVIRLNDKDNEIFYAIVLIITLLVATMISVYMLFIFSYQEESKIIKNDTVLIARIIPGFHHSQVEFFYPKNYFLLEESNIPIESLEDFNKGYNNN